MTTHVSCAGGIVFDEGGRLLLIQRGQPPSAGSWSIPGGRCEGGETGEQACIREVAEETGLAVVVLRWAGRVTREGPGEVSYDIDDYVCAVPGSSRTDRTGHDGTEHDGTEHDGTEHDGTEHDGTEHDGTEHDGELTAGSDAVAARWVNQAELARLPLVPLLAEALRSWDCLPRV